MSMPRPSFADLRRLASLAVPVTLAQVGLMAMGLEDSMIVGRLSATALAGVAMGAVFVFSFGSFGIGVLAGLEPVIAQAKGAGESDAISRAFQRGLVLVAALGALSALAFQGAGAFLAAVGEPPQLVAIAGAYVRVQWPSMFAFYGFMLLRITLQALEVTRPIVITIAAANVANVLLCWALVFGRLGAPALGTVGAGIATTIARAFMALSLLALGAPALRPLFRWRAGAASPRALAHAIRLGTPIGLQFLFEYGVFAVVALLMGGLGPTAAAAHQIAINIASLTYMVPLGVGTAGSVLVGHAIGAGDPAAARRAAASALAAGVGFMGLSALAFTFVPRLIARLYTPDPAAIALAATLIPIAGVFQVFDGLQVVSIGLLRGTGDTRTPMIVNLVGYWFVGLPVSLWLGYGRHLGPRGLWWGLVVGLAAVALIVAARMRLRLGGRLERIQPA